MMELEHEADPTVADRRQVRLVEPAIRPPFERDVAGIGKVEPAEQVQ